MTTVTITNLKGGTGKSTITILTANYLASLGNRVLVIDFDIQNSTSFFYLDNYEEAEKKNLARALYDDNLPANIITSNYPGVSLIPSSLSLVDLRAINERRLSRLMSQVEPEYDFLLIDTPPSWTNFTLNAIHAADLVISPVRLSSFDHKTAHFMKQKILQETEQMEHWHILINFFREPRTDNPENLTQQYLEMFSTDFRNILPVRIPESSFVQRAIDTRERISTAKSKERLFWAITELSAFITGRLVTAGGRF